MVKVVEWFGYAVQLLVDSRHEVVLSWRVTRPGADETEEVKRSVERAERVLPGGRMGMLTYDRAGEDGDVHKFLHERGIRAVIQNRAMWKETEERMLPGHDGRSNVVYDEAGTLYCYDKESDPPVRRRMVDVGYEKSRGTLKYRCPIRHAGGKCKSDGRCNRGKRYGKTVRVRCEVDFRRFSSVPRATKQFERIYKTRTAIERVNGRLKLFWGLDDGNVCGAKRFHAHVGAVMLVHMAFAHRLADQSQGKGVLCKTRIAQLMRHRAAHQKPT